MAPQIIKQCKRQVLTQLYKKTYHLQQQFIDRKRCNLTVAIVVTLLCTAFINLTVCSPESRFKSKAELLVKIHFDCRNSLSTRIFFFCTTNATSNTAD